MADETTPPTAPLAPRTEPLAIWSLVLSISSWFCFFITAIPGIIFGHVARSRIRSSNGALQGMNLAIAGLIIGYATIPFGVLGGIMLVDMMRSERVRLHDLAVEKKEITSDDGKLKITTSGFWVKRTDLNQKASLQAACPSEDLYLIVITEPKSSVQSVTLQQRHQAATDDKLQQMSNSSASASTSLTINGHRALQDELTGTQNRANLTFLHTTVDEGNSFDQIIAWTSQSHWQSRQQELRDAIQSFQSGE